MTTPQTATAPPDAGAPGNLAAQLAGLAERRGWGARVAFHQGHRVWTHGEVHSSRPARPVCSRSGACVPATGFCWRCPTASPG